MEYVLYVYAYVVPDSNLLAKNAGTNSHLIKKTFESWWIIFAYRFKMQSTSN